MGQVVCGGARQRGELAGWRSDRCAAGKDRAGQGGCCAAVQAEITRSAQERERIAEPERAPLPRPIPTDARPDACGPRGRPTRPVPSRIIDAGSGTGDPALGAAACKKNCSRPAVALAKDVEKTTLSVGANPDKSKPMIDASENPLPGCRRHDRRHSRGTEQLSFRSPRG